MSDGGLARKEKGEGGVGEEEEGGRKRCVNAAARRDLMLVRPSKRMAWPSLLKW